MKHYYLLLAGLLLLSGCSKDSNNDAPGDSLEACFTLSASSVSAGESFTISDCSKNATSYSYDFGDGNSSTQPNPSASYREGGEYTITLTVENDSGGQDSYSTTIDVVDAEANFLYAEIPAGYSAIPFESGINPVNGNFYSIELWEDNVGTGGSKYYYQELDATFNVTTNYLADRPYEANSAFVNFYASGNMNFVFARTLDALYGTQEVTYNAAWSFLNGINSASKHSYGFLPSGSNSLYFGTEDDGGLYKAAIETRNSSGDAFQVSLNSFGTADAMIGDMIESGSGYIAFGAVFTKSGTSPYVSGYKPLLVFYDNTLAPTSHIIYEDSVLDTKISSCNELNGSYHLGQLSNGNLVLYANGELIITDPAGVKLKSVYYEGTANNQSLLCLGNEFILSSADYLRKFDGAGNQVKSLKYNGDYLPEIVEFNGALFFIGGYDVEGEIKIFYGAMDTDLELFNLNP